MKKLMLLSLVFGMSNVNAQNFEDIKPRLMKFQVAGINSLKSPEPLLKSAIEYQYDSIINLRSNDDQTRWENNYKGMFTNYRDNRLDKDMYRWEGSAWSVDPTSQQKYHFNDANQLTKRDVYLDGDLYNTYEVAYDAQNRMLSETISEDNGGGVIEVYEIFDYEYNSDNTLKEMTYSGYDASSGERLYDSRVRYFYSAYLDSILVDEYSDSLQQWYVFGRIDVVSTSTMKTLLWKVYDQENQVYMSPEMKTEFEYDSNGNQIEMREYDWDGSSSSWDYVLLTTYDYENSFNQTSVFGPMPDQEFGLSYVVQYAGVNALLGYTEYEIDAGDQLNDSKFQVYYSAYDPIGIASKEIEEVRIYPNPAIDRLNIEGLKTGSLSSIKVYDMLGNLQITSEVFTNSHSINTEELKNGVYFIVVEGNENRTVRKFIKQ